MKACSRREWGQREKRFTRKRGSAKQLLHLLIAQHALNSPSFSWIRQKLTAILQVYFRLFMSHFFASFERVLYITKRLFSHRYITRTRERERSYRTWVWQCGVSRANTHILSECILVVAHSLKRLNFISQPALSAKKLSFPKMTPAMIPPGLQLCVFVSCRCTMMTFRMLLQNNNNREDEPRDVNIKKADWLHIWAQNAGWMTSRTHYDDF